jgi:hypothetical protein
MFRYFLSIWPVEFISKCYKGCFIRRNNTFEGTIPGSIIEVKSIKTITAIYSMIAIIKAAKSPQYSQSYYNTNLTES